MKTQFLAVFCALALSALACGQSSGGGLPATAGPNVINSGGTTAESLQQDWAAALSTAPGRPFELTITEAQLQSQIEANVAQGDYANAVENVAVGFDDGLAGLSYDLVLEEVPRRVITLSASFTMSVSPEGDLQITTQNAEVSSQLGSLNATPEMLRQANDALEQAFDEARASANVDVTYTSVIIDNDTLVISGTVTNP